jgi:hypothetical protein
MGQFSVEKPVLPGSVLSGNQHGAVIKRGKAGKRVESATLTEIVEPPSEFEGHQTGIKYREGFDRSDLNQKKKDMLERWLISKEAVEVLANGKIEPAPYLYNVAASDFDLLGRPKTASQVKIGQSIFSTEQILSKADMKIIKARKAKQRREKKPISPEKDGTRKISTKTEHLAIFPTLQVGHIDDLAERAAETVADRVMLVRDGGTCCPACSAGRPCVSRAEEIEHGQTGPLRRLPTASGGGLSVPANLEPRVRRATSGGEGLPAAVRAFFEPRFGQDLSHVRIHRDSDAAKSASALGARAYTMGDHIAFGRGYWAPGSASGDHLIAHELAHVAQQRARSEVKRKPVSGLPMAKRRDDPDIELQRLEAFKIIANERSHILSEARRFNISSDAIAGAILWEALENPYHRSFGRLGPAKVHPNNWFGKRTDWVEESEAEKIEEEKRVPPSRDLIERWEKLQRPSIAVTYIAAIMRRHADNYLKIAGVDISHNPAVLGTLYQGGHSESKAKDFAERRKKDPAAAPKAADEMGPWILANLAKIHVLLTSTSAIQMTRP